MKRKEHKQVKRRLTKTRRFLCIVACCSMLMMTALTLNAPTAKAAHEGDGAYDDPAHYALIINYIRVFWIGSLMKMTEQFSAVMMQQVGLIGELLDAKHQLETQALLQGMEAQAHKDYRPDVEICVIGTNIRSLTTSERKGKVNARALSEIMLKREVLSENAVSHAGLAADKNDRVIHFKEVFCDIHDNNGTLDGICTGNKNQIRPNNDIDFTRIVDTRLTLDVDFTDTIMTEDEEDILALSKNLFSHLVFKPIPSGLLTDDPTLGRYRNIEKYALQDMRSLIAMRGIARNSWGHLIGMRSASNMDPAYITALAEQIGTGSAGVSELQDLLGDNPSYFAQMEFLTKKMFQNPDFYVNLYTTPANVERKSVALQAIRLMQNRDRFETSLRKEMLISMLLELKVRELQEDVNNEILGVSTIRYDNPQ